MYKLEAFIRKNDFYMIEGFRKIVFQRTHGIIPPPSNEDNFGSWDA